VVNISEIYRMLIWDSSVFLFLRRVGVGNISAIRAGISAKKIATRAGMYGFANPAPYYLFPQPRVQIMVYPPLLSEAILSPYYLVLLAHALRQIAFNARVPEEAFIARA